MDTVLPLYDDVQIPVQDHDEKTDLCGYVFVFDINGSCTDRRLVASIGVLMSYVHGSER